jgi:hypothetical protein
MTSQESLDLIADLLSRLPTIEWARGFQTQDGRSLTIHFRCSSFESLGIVTWCAMAANIDVIACEPNARLCYEEDSAQGFKFIVRVEDDEQDYDHPTTTEMFGVYLARCLKDRGELVAAESDRIQRDWNAVPI